MYPVSNRQERLADGAVHAIGLLGAIIGAGLLLAWYADQVSRPAYLALLVYAAGLLATFTASAVYHLAPWHTLRPLLRRVDHAVIYLKIAATYTPIVVAIGSPLAYAMLGLVWTLAACGMIAKLFFWQMPGRYCALPYVLLGWMGTLLIWRVWVQLSGEAAALLTIGGVICTGGVIFFSSESRYSTAIWHLCVVLATGCFWCAIAIGAGSGATLAAL